MSVDKLHGHAASAVIGYHSIQSILWPCCSFHLLVYTVKSGAFLGIYSIIESFPYPSVLPLPVVRALQ